MIIFPSTSVGTFTKFFSTRKDIVFKYIIREIEKAVSVNQLRIQLFKFEEYQTIASLDKSEYLMTTEMALEFFIENEMYESAGKCRDLIKVLRPKSDRQQVEEFLSEISKPS